MATHLSPMFLPLPIPHRPEFAGNGGVVASCILLTSFENLFWGTLMFGLSLQVNRPDCGNTLLFSELAEFGWYTCGVVWEGDRPDRHVWGTLVFGLPLQVNRMDCGNALLFSKLAEFGWYTCEWGVGEE